MRSAYNETWVYNLAVIKETKRWLKQELIDEPQWKAIAEAYASSLYHPNFIIRILLFIATLLALSGVSGLLGLMIADMGEDVFKVGCVVYGITSYFFLKKVFIENGKHYKSGVTEALLYHACGFTIGGLSAMSDFNMHFLLPICLIVFSFTAIRYLDIISTLAASISLAGILFYECYTLGGIFQQIIPFVFMISFSIVYLAVRKLKTDKAFNLWTNNLILVESISLMLIYAAGNYLVVRELSINLMNVSLEEGQDIPFAFIFYALTVIIPVAFFYFGIKNKDVALLRVSLIVVAFSVFTFKYYYGFGHPEITLTLAGAILLGISISLFNYLKVIRGGYTRENHLAEKWGNLNLQAFIVSQTLGGNQVTTADHSETGGGGTFGGGGSTDSF